MTDISQLRSDFESAERECFKLQAEKDEALQEVRDNYWARLNKATDKAAAAQKALCDAEAAQTLIERYPDEDERRRVMAERGINLPEALS